LEQTIVALSLRSPVCTAEHVEMVKAKMGQVDLQGSLAQNCLQQLAADVEATAEKLSKVEALPQNDQMCGDLQAVRGERDNLHEEVRERQTLTDEMEEVKGGLRKRAAQYTVAKRTVVELQARCSELEQSLEQAQETRAAAEGASVAAQTTEADLRCEIELMRTRSVAALQDACRKTVAKCNERARAALDQQAIELAAQFGALPATNSIGALAPPSTLPTCILSTE
jgi:chromosome segregation ATPase